MLQIFERLYAALLVLYPKTFRSAYGRQMRLTFRDACSAAYRKNGAGGLLALWLPSLVDLFVSALVERVRRGEPTMLTLRLMTLSGPLTIVVGVLWLASAAGDFAFQTGLVRDEALLGLTLVPFGVSWVPLLVAQFGTRLRYDPVAGLPGRAGLLISLAGCVGAIGAVLAAILLGVGGVEPWPWLNLVVVVCILAVRVGYLLFGVDALRGRLLPRWKLLPLLLGATLVLSLPFDWFGVPAFLPVPGVTPFLHFAISGVCWVLYGIALTGPDREPRRAAAA